METEETGLQLMHFEEVNNTIVVSQVIIIPHKKQFLNW